MTVLFTNNATATLASGISSGATAIALTTGQGGLFPSPSGSGLDYFYATIVNASNQIEIVKCTARAGDTLTVLRGQDNTTARAYLSGDSVSLRPTAGAFTDMQTLTDGTVTASKLAANAVTNSKILDGAITVTKILDGAITAAKLAAGAVLGQLGFVPVKQTGGNTVRLEWASPYLTGYIDDVLQGNMLFERGDAAPTSAGYRGHPYVAIATSTILGFTHAGKMLVITVPGITITVPQFSDVAFGDGSEMIIINVSGGDAYIAPGTGSTVARAANGISATHTIFNSGRADLIRVTGNTWNISGEGLG